MGEDRRADTDSARKRARVSLSTLTTKGQTTIPKPMRMALGVGPNDRLAWRLGGDGEVVLTRAESPDAADPALGPFLDLVERDLAAAPERLVPIAPESLAVLARLVEGAEDDGDYEGAVL